MLCLELPEFIHRALSHTTPKEPRLKGLTAITAGVLPLPTSHQGLSTGMDVILLRNTPTFPWGSGC